MEDLNPWAIIGIGLMVCLTIIAIGNIFFGGAPVIGGTGSMQQAGAQQDVAQQSAVQQGGAQQPVGAQGYAVPTAQDAPVGCGMGNGASGGCGCGG
jgi:hypothetical protein